MRGFSVEEAGWRQIGCRLAETMQETTPDSYIALLIRVKAKVEYELSRLLPPDEGEPETQTVPVGPDAPKPLQEKVADHSIKGSGV